ncbi:MAG: uncharacterized protein QOE60_335 [Thermoleophilaceae bacterium]|jgi:uncharacterized membrane protein YedE/YeeE|nr:uncharacterized protein [Thermoleophilaceae bacterium]
MADFLLTRPPPFVIGAMLAFCIVGVLATLNERLGALGGYSAIYERVSARTPVLGWKAWFLVGILAGSLIFRLLAGADTVGSGYGWLTREFTDDWVVGSLLVLGGALIGFGAKLSSGCTAGNGICGTSLGSPASFVATGTFLGVAIAGTFLIDAVVA